MIRSFIPVFSSKSFMASGLLFKSLICFHLVFMNGVIKVTVSFFYLWRSIISAPIIEEYSQLSCQILVDFICLGLFLDFDSVPLVYLSVFMPASYCLITIALYYSLNQEVECLLLCSSFSRFSFSYSGSFVCVLVSQWCPTLCNPMDCSPPGSSVHGIYQAGKLEWVPIPFSRESS